MHAKKNQQLSDLYILIKIFDQTVDSRSTPSARPLKALVCATALSVWSGYNVARSPIPGGKMS